MLCRGSQLLLKPLSVHRGSMNDPIAAGKLQMNLTFYHVMTARCAPSFAPRVMDLRRRRAPVSIPAPCSSLKLPRRFLQTV